MEGESRTASPSSVKDRPACSMYAFLFTKSEHDFFDATSIQEPVIGDGGQNNWRTVWNINTEGFKGAHFAVFPAKLVELCVLAGAPVGTTVLDPFFGSGTVGAVSKRLHRGCVGIEMKPEYAEMAAKRISGTAVQDSPHQGMAIPSSMYGPASPGSNFHVAWTTQNTFLRRLICNFRSVPPSK